MEQAQLVKDQVRVRAKAWGVARVEVGWAGRLQQGRAGVAFARTAEQRSLMLRDSLVTQEAALNVVRQ